MTLSKWQFLILAVVGLLALPVRAQPVEDPPAQVPVFPADPAQSIIPSNADEGFSLPYRAEREAYGYDPEGMEYRQNRAEDFQVIFISSAPFAAIFSYGVTTLVSYTSRGTAVVNGDYFKVFVAGTVATSATIAAVSVFTNKYPPPAEVSLPSRPLSSDLAFRAPLVEVKF